MEKRNIKIMYSKNGYGNENTRISLPVKWLRQLGFTKEERNAIIYLKNNSIIIKKGEINE